MLLFLVHPSDPKSACSWIKAVVAADDDLQVIEDLAAASSDGFEAS